MCEPQGPNIGISVVYGSDLVLHFPDACVITKRTRGRKILSSTHRPSFASVRPTLGVWRSLDNENAP